jgi:hypothetical protein
MSLKLFKVLVLENYGTKQSLLKTNYGAQLKVGSQS